MKKKINFGIIGCGLMGREFASAAARWCHLKTELPAPRIIGVCDVNPDMTKWFSDNFSGIEYITNDYKELLQTRNRSGLLRSPHNLQESIYIDIIKAGKHLLASKPFGIDKANRYWRK